MTASGEWRDSGYDLADELLVAAGLDYETADRAITALREMLVVTPYYVPTFDELTRQYHMLGYAHLRGRLKVRWVMCAETRDALAQQYGLRRYHMPDDLTPLAAADPPPSTEVIRFQVRTVMERSRRWSDHGHLLGIPIRIDPAARSPMFEIVE